MKLIETAIVRIFATDSDSPVGVGFLISHNRVMTCAHVVASAVNIDRDEPEAPTQEIPLDFPLVDDNKRVTARAVLWLPPQPDGTDDIAILELTEQRPMSTTVANLVKVEQLSGRKFGAFGFPHSDGGWAHGEVRGRISGRRNQIVNKDEKSYFIEPGFSGGPVYCFDEDVQGVIGMVASGERDPDLDVGFMIPADVLLINKDSTNVEWSEPDQSEAADAEDQPDDTRRYSSQLFSRQTQSRVVYIGKFEAMKRHFKPDHIFIAHRFGDHQSMEDYRMYLSDGLTNAGYIAVFARDDSGTLLETIAKDIIGTEAGVYDVTGYNANVLIELGMSIGLNQPTVIIAEDDDTSLIPAIEELKPLRYKDRIDLAERLGAVVHQRVQAHRRHAINPLYCTACGRSDCNCRKSLLEPERKLMLIGADQDTVRKMNCHLKKVLSNFELSFLSVTEAFDLQACLWVESVKRSKIIFFHSVEGDTRHSGVGNVETMLQIGIAIGRGTAWRMILNEGDRMPTDLEGYKYTSRSSSDSVFQSYMRSAIRQLVNEHRPYTGLHKPLPTTNVNEINESLELNQVLPISQSDFIETPQLDASILVNQIIEVIVPYAIDPYTRRSLMEHAFPNEDFIDKVDTSGDAIEFVVRIFKLLLSSDGVEGVIALLVAVRQYFTEDNEEDFAIDKMINDISGLSPQSLADELQSIKMTNGVTENDASILSQNAETPQPDVDARLSQLSFKFESAMEREIAVRLIEAGWADGPYRLQKEQIVQTDNRSLGLDYSLHDAQDKIVAFVVIGGERLVLDRGIEQLRGIGAILDATVAYLVLANKDMFKIEINSSNQAKVQQFISLANLVSLIDRKQKTPKAGATDTLSNSVSPTGDLRVDRDALTSIRRNFESASQQATDSYKRLAQVAETVRDNGWIGDSADRFFAEMDNEIFPAFERLADALGESSEVISKLSQLFSEAEESAATYFEKKQ